MAMLAAALVMSLVLGAGFLVVNDRRGGVAVHSGLTDTQAIAAVVDSARQIVSVAQLHDVSGGYSFVSCRNADEPPYQVALYMNFRLPQRDSVRYLQDVAAAMAASGWSNAPSMAEHFGYKLTRNGVTSMFHRDPNDATVGSMRLYGECRVTTDHRHDNPAWIEVTQLG